MKELKPPGNDIQMTMPHENRFSPAAEGTASKDDKEGCHE